MMNRFLSIIALSTTIIVVYILFVASGLSKSSYVHSSTSGSPGGKTGSPSDLNSCLQCHSGSMNPGSVTRSITAPALASGYAPGQTYTITASVSNSASSKIGFEVTSEIDATNTKTGGLTITDASRTKLVNLSDAVTHTTNGTSASGGANTWSFDWTAPVQGTGSITFYGAFNVSNSGQNSGGDQIYTTTLTVQESLSTSLSDEASFNSLIIYPNPSNGIVRLNGLKTNTKVSVYTTNGELIQMATANRVLHLSGLAEGVYLLHLSDGKNSIIKKIIKK